MRPRAWTAYQLRHDEEVAIRIGQAAVIHANAGSVQVDGVAILASGAGTQG